MSICLNVLSLLELLGLLVAVGRFKAGRVFRAGVDLLFLQPLEKTFIVGVQIIILVDL